MDVLHFVIGRRRTSNPLPPVPVVTSPPADVNWVHVVSRSEAHRVRAKLAGANGVLKTKRGRNPYRRAHHYLVDYAPGDRAVVERGVFERIYERIGEDHYRKRAGLLYRYFTLTHPAMIATAEGPERAEPGDWIVEGVMGELYPMSAARGREIYEPIG